MNPQYTFDQNLNNSFVPDNTLRYQEERDWFRIISVIILISSFVVSGALYFYNSVLSNSLEVRKSALKNYEEQLSAIPLEDIRALSSKIKLANSYLNNKINMSAALDVFETVVEDDTLFSKVDITKEESKTDFSVKLSARTTDYKSVVVQAESFRLPYYYDVIKDVKVTSVALTQTGNIAYDIDMTFNLKNLPFEYRRELDNKIMQ